MQASPAFRHTNVRIRYGSSVPLNKEPTPAELRKRIGRWLEWYRDHYKVTQRAIATALEISEAHVSQVISAKETPGLDTFVRMHYRLGLDLTKMVRTEPAAESPKDIGLTEK